MAEKKEPPFRIVNGRKVYDVTTITDSVRRPLPAVENEAPKNEEQKETD